MGGADRLLALAVALLPADARDRYRQEFAAELADLPPASRMGYAARVLWSAPRLRGTLRPLPPTLVRGGILAAGVLALVMGAGVAYGIVLDRELKAPMTINATEGAAPTHRWTYAIDPSPVSADNLHRTITVAGEGAVVVMGEEAIAGVDPRTGAELWRHALPEVDTERGIDAIRGTPYVGSDALGGQEVAEPDQRSTGALLNARTGDVALLARDLELPPRSVSGAFAGGVLTVGPRVNVGDHPYDCSLAHVSLHGLDGQPRWTTTVRVGDPAPTFAKVVGDRLFLGLAPTHGVGDWPATTIVDAATGAAVAQTDCAKDVSTGFLPLPDGGWIQVDESAPMPGQVRARAMTSAGEVRWTHDGQISVAGGMVFAHRSDEAGNWIAARRVDPLTGRALWPAEVPGSRIEVRDGSVAVTERIGAIDDGTRVTIVDAETGQVRARHDVDFPTSMWGAEETGPLLLLEDQNSSGDRPMPLRVAAFDLRTAEKLWQLTVSRGETAFLHEGQLIVIDQQIGRIYGFR